MSENTRQQAQRTVRTYYVLGSDLESRVGPFSTSLAFFDRSLSHEVPPPSQAA